MEPSNSSKALINKASNRTKNMQIKHFNHGTVNKNEVSMHKEFTETKEKNDVSLYLYFSYRTCIGFRLIGTGKLIEGFHQNDWSTTTGKFLNELEQDKSKRMPAKDFEVALEKAIKLFEQA